MKNKLLFLFIVSIIVFNVDALYSQKIWTKVQQSSYLVQKKEIYQKKNFPSDYEIISLDLNAFSSQLKSNSLNQKEIIELPNSEGGFSRFSLKETSNFEEKLQAKFPNIKSYSAQGIDDPTAIAKISVGTDGFHAVIFSGKKETIYIDTYSKDNKDYIVYKRSSLKKEENDLNCLVDETGKQEVFSQDFARNANDGKLRTFRLALTCSGEYAQFHLGATQQNIAVTATDEVKKAAVLSAMNTSMTRINGVFEKDLSIKLVLVADNDEIIFLDADTDNITDGSPDTMINEVQTICDTAIGNANYDIGHIFSIGGDGLAGLGVVCVSGQKARGVTGRSQPVGDAYDIDFVIHELGHQFGATHTQNNDCNRTNSTAVEPGSGSTIMGYAGICSPNVQEGNANGNSDAYFHAVSIAQMWNVIQSSGSCGVVTNTDNNAPVADAGLDYSIPKSTPFKLKGTATDVDGLSSLTYNWEQLDNETATMPPVSSSDEGPMFRSLPSKDSPERYMPALATVISGNTSSTWEVLPSVAREFNFSFFVRDNNAGGGSSDRDDLKLTVTDDEAFTVTSQNTAETLNSGQTISVTWNKGTTDIAPIECKNVNIKLSIDGGITFPITLKTNTPNDGSESIIVPDNATASARIMVEAADNIFYNVNTSPFVIVSSTPTFLISDNSGEQSVCNTGTESISYNLDFDFINGFTEVATLSATGNPSGSTIAFSSSTIDADGTVTLTISNLEGKEAKSYDINVVGTSATVTQNIDLVLNVRSSTFNSLTLLTPVNDATGVSITETLTWEQDSNASSYDIEVALDAGFSNIISSKNVAENSFKATDLNGETQYFWRVKPKNDCGEGNFSAIFSFTTETPMYCTSTFTDEAGGTEYISNVTFGGINNDSDNDTTDGYQDFTNINANVLREQTKQISVTFDTGGYQDHCFVFIDWNKDYIFDADTEKYDLGSITDNVGTATFNITVPTDAKFGKTTMRVLIEYDDPTDGYGSGACDADHLTEWGETEDYSITIVEPVLNDDNYTIETIHETIYGAEDGIINVTMNQDEFTYQLSLTGVGVDNNETLSSPNYSVDNLSPGDYEICITAIEPDVTSCFTVTINKAEAVVDFDNITVETTSESCVDENDGIIDVAIKQSEFEYQITIVGPSTNIDKNLTALNYSLSNLVPGDYEVCILVSEINFKQCFEVSIEESQPVSLKVASKTANNNYSFSINSGTAPYEVYLNEELISVSNDKEFDVEIKESGKLEVKTAKECEGLFKTSIGDVVLRQNPIIDSIDLLLPIDVNQTYVDIIIFDVNGNQILKQSIKKEDNNLIIPFRNYAKGIYILKLSIENSKPIKILK
ncbi:Metallo-peptidase family M12B Reprolysin-like [Polaribacter sp. KT25b]|uniref:reprolysin-like metallopeptidase n=1 Tax=Polaribacter sp. KT25b TaxID=1855336 RepID=UPI00087ACFCE|nr:zinc-dependent metalloprotease family protein [Polaribacter sp. KT25b]SDR69323.1 Metallo-peptidase family M12B Reprolysin-like [Polaribacter sp. KT25b]